MTETAVRLEESWRQALASEFASPYMGELKSFLREQLAAGRLIYPKGSEYFRALPRNRSAGYFSALSMSFRAAASPRSMSRRSARRTR